MNSHRCTTCEKGFGRLEHLKRHEQIHKDREFHCSKCAKRFHRKDALNKHLHIHQMNKPSLLQRGARACSSCAGVKSRCSGDAPCERCNAKGLTCSYPSKKTIRGSLAPTTPLNQDRLSPGAFGIQPGYSDFQEQPSGFRVSQPQPLHTRHEPNLHNIVHEGTAVDSNSNGAFVQPSASLSHANIIRSPFHTDATLSPFDWTSNMMPTINWLQSDTISFNNEDLDIAFPVFSEDYSFSPDVLLISPAHQQRIDPSSTVCFSGAIVNQQEDHSITLNQSWDPQTANPMHDYSSVTDKSTAGSGEYYVDGDVGRLPRSKRRKIMLRTDKFDETGKLAFTLEYGFPVMSCLEKVVTLTDEKYEGLHTLFIQVCWESKMSGRYSSCIFPEKQALEGLLSSYFSHFEQAMPFLHFEAFRAESRHDSLLLAMMALGSCFVEGDGSEIFALSMHEFVRRYLVLTEEENLPSPEKPETLAQVQLLHAVGAQYSLYEPFRRSAARAIHSASNYCRDIWIRRSPPSTVMEGDDRWLLWIENEETTRTGYCIWLLDCMWTFQFQKRPNLELEVAAGMKLPCSDLLWTARDVSHWGNLIAENFEIPNFLEAIRNLYVDKRLLPGLGEFSRILLIHGILHRTWQVQASVSQKLSRVVPCAQKQASSEILPKVPIWPPSDPLFNKWRNSACDSVDILHWSANATIGAASGIEHPTVLHLHLSRVVLLAPLNEIILFSHHLIRSSKDHSGLFPSITSEEAEDHKRLIQRWAIQDQYKARLGAIHAGVLFWHVRRYATNSFYEPSAVALAALLLWAFSAFSNRLPNTRKTNNAANPATEVLSPDFCDIILLDRPTDDELVQQFVRQGNLMRANMTGVGDLLGPAGSRRVLAEAQKLLRTLGTWKGVTNYWLKALNRLESVTALASVNANASDTTTSDV